MTKKKPKLSKKQQINNLKKICDRYEVPDDLIDLESFVDDTLEYEENKNHLIEKIRTLCPDKETQINADFKTGEKSSTDEKEKIDKVDKDNIEQIEAETQKELEKSINQIKFDSTSVLEKSFRITNSLVKTLCSSQDIHGLILVGSAGLGKSYNVLKALKEMGYKKGKDFETLNSYVTPLELYKFLYENKDDKIIVFDDTMGFFQNKTNIGLILASLWGEGKRKVTYSSGTGKLKIPNQFLFNSKIVWCANQLPNGLEAVKSRCYYYEISFTYQEKIEMMYEMAKLQGIPFEVVDFIKEETDETIENLDFRLLFKIYNIYQNRRTYYKNDWKAVSREMLGLQKDEKMALLKKYLEESDSVKEARQIWTAKTGQSNRQFWRYKALKEQRTTKLRGNQK